ncbi:MAG: serine O-acetyltransferase EpsC [bacterium]
MTDKLNKTLNEIIEKGIQECPKTMKFPSKQDVSEFMKELRYCLYPNLYQRKSKTQIIPYLEKILEECSHSNKETLIESFINYINILRETLLLDAKAIYEGDPAAKDLTEVRLCYPGFHAILYYRTAHFFYKHNINYLPRIITEISNSKTGIDIHPGAEIGESFCIDHGNGIVIGETAKIGNSVKIYQGVTLGAFSVTKKTQGKRHPTLKNNVTVYARSTILGGNTIIGEGTIIGGNAWIIKSVPAYSTVYVSQPSNQKIIKKK